MTNIFIALEHLVKKTEPRETFGILLLPNLIIIKKKIKNDLIKNISKENLTAILTVSNPKAYYNNEESFEEVIGVEMRYEREVDKWFEEKAVIGEILNKIKLEKKK